MSLCILYQESNFIQLNSKLIKLSKHTCTYREMLSLKGTLYFTDFLDWLGGLQTGLTHAADSELCPSGNFVQRDLTCSQLPEA